MKTIITLILLIIAMAFALSWMVSNDPKPVRCGYQNEKTTLTCDDNGTKILATIVRDK